MASLSDLARLRPQLAHVTFSGGWESIRRTGLWSVSKLVSEANLPPGQAKPLLTTYRSDPGRLTTRWKYRRAP